MTTDFDIAHEIRKFVAPPHEGIHQEPEIQAIVEKIVTLAREQIRSGELENTAFHQAIDFLNRMTLQVHNEGTLRELVDIHTRLQAKFLDPEVNPWINMIAPDKRPQFIPFGRSLLKTYTGENSKGIVDVIKEKIKIQPKDQTPEKIATENRELQRKFARFILTANADFLRPGGEESKSFKDLQQFITENDPQYPPLPKPKWLE